MLNLLSLVLTLISISAIAGENKIVFEKIVRINNSALYHVKNIQLETPETVYRVKASNLNQKRICESLGFRDTTAGRWSFSMEEVVVGINKDLEVTRLKKPETLYIENANCIK